VAYADPAYARRVAYIEALPPQQRGTILLGLWLNAVLTLTLQGAQLALAIRVLQRTRHSHEPLRTALEYAVSPSTAAVLSASAVHKLARQRFVRVIDRRCCS